MANEIHNLEKVLVYLKCSPTCRIHQEHLNTIKTAVNFVVDLLNSTKFPEMEILGFLEKFITYEWFRGQRLKIYQACHGRLSQLGGLQ